MASSAPKKILHSYRVIIGNMINLTGKWKGSIIYGPEYGPDEGKELLFEAELKQDGELFSGIAKDTNGVGMSPDPATINGSFNQELISFEKIYDSFHYSDENGNTIINKETLGTYVIYEGAFIRNENKFRGIWTIDSIISDGEFVEEMYCTGTWSMWRQD